MPPQTPYQPPQDDNLVLTPTVLATAPGPVPVAQPAVPPPQPVTVERHLVRNLLATLGLLIILVLVFMGGAYTHIIISHKQDTNAATTAQAFIRDINQNDPTVAYASTSPNLQKKESLSQFIAALSNLTATKPKTISSLTTHNDNIAVYTEVEDGLPANASGLTTATWTIQLVKSGITGWVVDSAHVE